MAEPKVYDLPMLNFDLTDQAYGIAIASLSFRLIELPTVAFSWIRCYRVPLEAGNHLPSGGIMSSVRKLLRSKARDRLRLLDYSNSWPCAGRLREIVSQKWKICSEPA